jgi:hypothetical protein
VSQSAVWRVEAGGADDVDLKVIGAIFEALGGTLDVAVRSPIVLDDRRPRDPAHARLVAYVAKRLQRLGWAVRTEVEVRSRRAIGWIDVLAFRAADAACRATEVKSDLPDIGGAQRQVEWYVRESFTAARSLGWRPRRATGLLLVLDTHRNAEVIQANAQLFRAAFPARAPAFREWLATPAPSPPRLGLAAVDPLSRRDGWLKATPPDGRRTAARYPDYAGFIRAVANRTAKRRAG